MSFLSPKVFFSVPCSNYEGDGDADKSGDEGPVGVMAQGVNVIVRSHTFTVMAILLLSPNIGQVTLTLCVFTRSPRSLSLATSSVVMAWWHDCMTM